MEPMKVDVDTLRLVTASRAEASGAEVVGGPRDGSVDALFVVAQLELVEARHAAGTVPSREVLHLGFTREAAVGLARQLVHAAGRLPRA